jgi:alpha-ketoglutaric semialdehyde dehydrogenase
MSIIGDLLIGNRQISGEQGEIRAIEAATGKPLEPAFGGASRAQMEEACRLAALAFNPYRQQSSEARAQFLETIAENILGLGEALIERCMAETGLPRGRIEGERGRTVGQLRLFAMVVRDGNYLDLRVDPALPERKPLPRVDLRLRNIALGPVVVFGASNFPLAFSVAGGDTASALAAGCPVIVKAHSAHPGTSALVGQAVQQAAAACDMPEGVFSLLFAQGREIAQALVADRRVKAVGFTGSRGGGIALMRTAAARPEPIPVYAEMSSINPVLLLPGALAERGGAIGRAFVGALTLGAGQFCTNPGLILAEEGPGLDGFLQAAAESLAAAAAATMLTPGIHQSYCAGVAALARHAEVKTIGLGLEGATNQGQAGLFSTTATAFLAHPELQGEVFGAAALVVRAGSAEELRSVVEALEGQLTAAVHFAESDIARLEALLPLLEGKAGRILANGFGTGVEVSHAMVHGGPYPATSDGRSTSVGTLAIRRFLRPICYQDIPNTVLPEELRDGNPLGFWRQTDGMPGKE